MSAALRGLFANLRAGARLALFARVQRQQFRVDAAQLLLVVVVSALVDNATDWVRQPPEAVFDWAALGAELASFAVLVAIAAVLAWAFGDVSLVVALPIVVLASLPLMQIATLAPQLAGARDELPAWLPETLYSLVLVWFLAVLWRSAFVAMQPGRRRFARSLAGGLLLAVRLFVPAGVLPEASWWTQAAAPPALYASNPASEPVLALQRELQDEALGALEEIAAASNPDEDIVMLYLAGRSNPDGSLLVSLPPLGLVQLTGAGLAHLFRQAGIRWRVIVVATCAPQSFVDALADDYTLVIAAAGRAERAPGCAPGEEPTAFGDALFGETLSGATSLPAALKSVRRTLAQRGPAPSLHVGDAIGAQLARLRGAGGRANARAARVNG